MSDESSAGTAAAHGGNWIRHLVWIGLLTTILGALSYFLFTYQYPDLRDFPVVNLPLVVLGVALTTVGCIAVFRHGGKLGKIAAGISAALVLGLAGLFCFYIFWYSYQLPDANRAVAIDTTAPEFALPDQKGDIVKLSDFRGKKVVLVFYRGNW